MSEAAMNCLINASISSSLPSDDKIFIAPGVIEFGICIAEIYVNHEAGLWGVNPIYRGLQGVTFRLLLAVFLFTKLAGDTGLTRHSLFSLAFYFPS